MSTQPTSQIRSRSPVALKRGEENPVSSLPHAIGSDAKCEPSNSAEDILTCDVLLGRGKSIHCHPGNIAYREIIKERCRLYKSEDGAQEKDCIAQEVIQSVKDAGGRFLRPICDTGGWQECTRAVVRTKVKQALRDIIKERRPAAHQSDSSKRKRKNVISASAETLPLSYRSLDSNADLSRHEINVLQHLTVKRSPIESLATEANVYPSMNYQGPTICLGSEPHRADASSQFSAIAFQPTRTSSVTDPSGVAEATNDLTAFAGAVIAEVAKRRYLDQLLAAFGTTSSTPIPQGSSVIQQSTSPLFHTSVLPVVTPQQQDLQRILDLLQSQQQPLNPSALSYSSFSCIGELLRRLRDGRT